MMRQAMKQIPSCQRAVAMVEFAFAAPVFLVLLMAGLEVTNLALAHLRVNQIAITVADNAGRVRSGIDETNIYELFAGAELIGSPIEFPDNGRIVLSSLEPNGRTGADEGQMINWQRCYGELDVDPAYGGQGTGRTDSSLADGMGAGDNRIKSASGTAVMFVEATYSYTPRIFSILETSPITIRYESAYNVRERTNQNISNTQNLTNNLC